MSKQPLLRTYVGALILRRAHRGEENAVCGQARRERLGRQGVAGRADAGPAEGLLVDLDREWQGTECADRLSHHFWADPVALEADDPERRPGLRHEGASFPISCSTKSS